MNFWSNNRMNRIQEVVDFEKERNITATYFFVMRPGLGVAYHYKDAKRYIDWLLKQGHDVGVHGMNYKDIELMKEEYERFSSLSGLNEFGIRMHYLRNDESTFEKLAAIGYRFDSTYYNIRNPYKVGRMIEFPISVMDVYCVHLRSKTITSAQEHTLALLNQAEKGRIPYFVINFHDVYFRLAYPLYKEWFEWLIDLCIDRGYEFTSFKKEIDFLTQTDGSFI